MKIKENIPYIIGAILIVAGASYLVGLIWILLEVLIYGEARQDIVDNIMGVILVISLLFNLKNSIEKDMEEENGSANK